MKRNSFFKGALLLAIAGIISKFLGFLYRVPALEILGTEGYALYSYPQWLFVTMIAISTGGFSVAISKLVSENVSLNRHYKAYRIFKTALIMLTVFGAIVSMILLFGSKFIVGLFWPEKTFYSLLAISIAPLFVAILTAYRGYFAGLQIMTPIAISQIVEAIGRLFIGLYLAYVLLDYGEALAAGGASFSATIGAIIALLIIIFIYYKNKMYLLHKNEKENDFTDNDTTKDIIKAILTISIPVAIGSVATTLMPLVDSLMVKPRLELINISNETINTFYSLLATSSTIIALPLTFSLALSTSLVPAISRARVLKNDTEVKRKIQLGFKMGVYVSLPSAVGLYVLAGPIIKLLFNKLSVGDYNPGFLMKILSVGLPFIMLSQLMTSMLQAVNRINKPVKNLLLGSIIKFILSYFLIVIPTLNIKGPAIATVIAHIIVASLNFYHLKKYTSFKLDLKDTIIKPLFASGIMYLSVLGSYNIILKVSGNTVATLSSVVIGGLIYGLIMFKIGAIDKSVIETLVKRR